MIKMKDSGVEWIGVVPKNWEIERLQWHLFEIVEKNDPIKTTQILSLTNKKGVIPYEEKGNQGNTAKENYDGYKIAYPDTIVANSMNILIGSVGYSKLYGCVSPVYYVFKEKNNNDLRFINYIMQTSQFQRELRKYANGILEIRLRVSASDILKQKCAFPNIQTQTLISDYLDEKCAKIDEIIAKQQAVIEKLKEYKLSVITEAVTKGLNPDVEMKDSGMGFIGKIPYNATITRVGHLYDIILGKMLCTSPKNDSDSLEPYFCAANVHFEGVDSSGLKQMWFSNSEKESYLVKNGDLLVVEGGAGAGGAAIVESIDAECYIQNSIMIVREKKGMSVDNKWLYYSLYSLVKRSYIDFVCNKATIPHFTKEKLSNTPIVLLEENEIKAIVQMLDLLSEKIDNQIHKKELIINKLTEYKKSLIYEVVTGKKEV